MAASDKDWVDYFGDFNSTKLSVDTDTDFDNSKNGFNYYDNQTGYPRYSNFSADDFCQSNHSHFYLNVTCEFPINYAEPMYG